MSNCDRTKRSWTPNLSTLIMSRSSAVVTYDIGETPMPRVQVRRPTQRLRLFVTWREMNPFDWLSRNPRSDNLCLAAKQLSFTKTEAARFDQLLKEETTEMASFFGWGKYRCNMRENGFVIRARMHSGIPPVIRGAFEDKDNSLVLTLRGQRSLFNKYFPYVWFAGLIFMNLFALSASAFLANAPFMMFMFAMGALVTYGIRQQDLISIDDSEDFLNDLIKKARSG